MIFPDETTRRSEDALASAPEGWLVPDRPLLTAGEPAAQRSILNSKLEIQNFELGRSPQFDAHRPVSVSGVVSPAEIAGRVPPPVAAVVAPAAGAAPGEVVVASPGAPHESEPTGALCIEPSGDPARRSPREAHLRAGARRAAAVQRARALLAEGRNWDQIAAEIGESRSTLHRWATMIPADTQPTAETCADRTYRNGSAPTAPELTPAEFAQVRALYLLTNRTRDEGSIVEALLQAMERQLIRPAMCDLVRTRLAAGQSPLTERQMHRLRLAAPVITSARGPRRAWLEHVQSPGSLGMRVNPLTGEMAPIPPGDTWTIDDGSINLLVIVPGLQRPGDRCYDRWGVVVGRFQLLLTVDHASRCIVGRSYTARPRDSYRAEDITAALQVPMMDHGAPRHIVLEKGISAARLVTETLGGLGVRIIRASSPHQKVVESVFNVLWTALSTLPGQVGRFRGEEEAVNRTLTRIRSGAFDPRGQLMTMPEFLGALDTAIARCNQRWVDGDTGRWQPAEWYARESAAHLTPVDATRAWLFSPHITQPLLVDGALVETSLQLLEGISTRFTFGEDWLVEWHGARVKLHFNPISPDCYATAVLAHEHRGHRAGHVLGRLEQQNLTTKYTRRALGYGLDPDTGREFAAATSRGLVRATKSIRADGKGATAVEIRDASGVVRQVEVHRTDATGESVVRGSSLVAPRTTNHEPRTTTPPRYTDPRLAEMEAELLADLD
jgi:hypothetical protein